jgi:hypothetical protein
LDEKVNLQLDFTDQFLPTWTVLNDDLDPDIMNQASHYELSEFDYRETFSSTTNKTGALNLNIPYGFGK